MKPEISLDAELQQQVLAAIRSGAYVHVAAVACGISRALWDKWRRKTGAPYKEFFRKVDQAEAQARLKAEVAVLQKDPRFWLKHGPGREQPGKPGWSSLTKPQPNREDRFDLFASAVTLRMLSRIREALGPYPDALAAAGHALVDLNLDVRKRRRKA